MSVAAREAEAAAKAAAHEAAKTAEEARRQTEAARQAEVRAGCSPRQLYCAGGGRVGGVWVGVGKSKKGRVMCALVARMGPDPLSS